MKRPKSDYEIQTVRNAFRLLEAFRHADELGVTELSRALELHKNNVFRLLATMEQAGYVEQAPGSDRYRLGVRCVELGRACLRGRGLRRLSRPLLEALAARCGEGAHLGTLDGTQVLHLEGAIAPRMIQPRLRVGSQLPGHCTAMGKVLLAWAAPVLLDALCRAAASGESPLERRTGSTIVDPDKLREQLHGVASAGYALDLEEYEEGLCCAGAPVFDEDGRVVAALSVSAPAFRARETLERELVPPLLEAADELSRQLGAPR